MGKWRDISLRVIAETIQRVGTDDLAALQVALREAYPFGERAYWPYKVWLREQRAALAALAPPRQLDLPLFSDESCFRTPVIDRDGRRIL